MLIKLSRRPRFKHNVNHATFAKNLYFFFLISNGVLRCSPPPLIVALIMWLNDCDPKPGTHHAGVWPLLSCLCPVWSAADDGSRTLLVLLFVLITFTTRPQLSGHYPIQTEISCRQAVITTRIRAGQWTFEARIVLLQVNASFMILTTCSRSEPQSQFRYLVWTNL